MSIFNVANKNQSHDRIGWHKFSSAFSVTNAQFGKIASYDLWTYKISLYSTGHRTSGAAAQKASEKKTMKKLKKESARKKKRQIKRVK